VVEHHGGTVWAKYVSETECCYQMLIPKQEESIEERSQLVELAEA